MEEHNTTEEILNAVTHGIGVLLSIAGLVAMLHSVSARQAGREALAAALLYGISLIVLYLMSTLYHCFFKLPKASHLFKIFDHAAIYLLIAGTDTPVLLILLHRHHGPEGTAVIWLLALIGIIWQCFNVHKYKKLSTAAYIVMGWLLVGALPLIWVYVAPAAVFWLLSGGLIYTVGTFFYLRKTMPYHHLIWHFFVLGGSMAHFYSIYYYLLPASPLP